MVFDQDCSWSAAFDLEAMACGFRPSIFVGSSDERDQERLNCLKKLYAISLHHLMPSREIAAHGLFGCRAQRTAETSSARCSTGCFSEDLSGKVRALVGIASRDTYVQLNRHKYIQSQTESILCAS